MSKLVPLCSVAFALCQTLIAVMVTWVVSLLVCASASHCWEYADGSLEAKIQSSYAIRNHLPLANEDLSQGEGYYLVKPTLMERYSTPIHAGVSFVMLCVAIFVFRAAHRGVHPDRLFKVCFFSGLGLLGYCLLLVRVGWQMLGSISFQLSGPDLQPLFSIPMTFMILVPAGLFLLAFATYQEATRVR